MLSPKHVLVEQEPVADAELGALLAGEQPAVGAEVDRCVLRRHLRLAVEEVGDGVDGVELELLVGVELQLHRLTPSGTSRLRP